MGEIYAQYFYCLQRIDLDGDVVPRIEIPAILLSPFLLVVRPRGNRAVQRCYVNISCRLEGVFGERVKVAENMQKRLRKRFVQPNKPLMGHDHALTRIESRLLYSFPNAFPVELQYVPSRRLQLRHVFLISLGALNCLRSPGSVPEGVNYTFIFGFDLAMEFSSDWIFPPVRWAPAETGEADIADHDHIRMNEVAVVPERGFVA